jgi:hypothetical protein
MLTKKFTHLFFQIFASLVDSSGDICHDNDIMDLSSLPAPPAPPSHEVSLPPPRLSFIYQKRHLFDAFVVVGTFPGFKAWPPPCRHAAAATAANSWEKKKKKEDKGGGQGTSSPSPGTTKTMMDGGTATTRARRRIQPEGVARPIPSEVQNKMIIMGHQISSCHVPVVRSFFIL